MQYASGKVCWWQRLSPATCHLHTCILASLQTRLAVLAILREIPVHIGRMYPRLHYVGTISAMT